MMVGSDSGMYSGEQQQSHGYGSTRDPPAWGPDMERRSHPYMFETWARDVMMWTLCTNARLEQQAAAIAMRLDGIAREVARTIEPHVLVSGGMIGTPPQQVDAVTYLMQKLRERFAPMAEETLIRAVMELETFHRNAGETTDALLTRFEHAI